MIRILGFLCLLVSFLPAQAHLLPKQNATMNVIDNAAFFVVSVPVSALRNVDDDGNRLLSNAEVQRHNESIQSQFASGFKVVAGQQAGSSVLTWLVPPQTDGHIVDADYVIVMHRVNFPVAPQELSLETSLFGVNAGESQMTITATRGTNREVVILDSSRSIHTFFRGPLAVFASFVGIGIEHILTGADHLAFLLTVLVAGAGVRYWFAVVTAFTLAHSITLVLAALKIVQISVSIVEPGIAASIVLIALINIFSANTQLKSRTPLMMAVVFSCGLLHGFGFASAIGVFPIDGVNRIATLSGFNVGIEIGQLLFVGAALVLVEAIRRLAYLKSIKLLPQVSSALAATFGAIWFAQAVMNA
jgi:hydrogenase/urease accessory protein HupE